MLVTDAFKVALRLKFKDDEIVQKEDIAKVVKCLIEEEGKGMRERMMHFKDVAAKTLKGGSSTKTLSQLASQWENLGGI